MFIYLWYFRPCNNKNINMNIQIYMLCCVYLLPVALSDLTKKNCMFFYLYLQIGQKCNKYNIILCENRPQLGVIITFTFYIKKKIGLLKCITCHFNLKCVYWKGLKKKNCLNVVRQNIQLVRLKSHSSSAVITQY